MTENASRRMIAISTLMLFAQVALICATTACSNSSGQDKTLAAAVQSKLAADQAPRGETVVAAANSGVVKLTGTVRSENERMAADEDAQIAGVSRVDNQLAVNSAVSQPTDGAQATPPDAAPASGLPTGNPDAAAPPDSNWVEVAEGTPIPVRLDHSLGSDSSQPGQGFEGRVTEPVRVNGAVVIPRGAGVSGTVVAADSSGHFEGRSRLELRLTELEFDGQSYDLRTRLYSRETEPEGQKSGEEIGGATGIGAVIGAIAGHGKGAAIGAVGGAAGGAAAQEVSKPAEVELPAETVVRFSLSAPVRVRPAGN